MSSGAMTHKAVAALLPAAKRFIRWFDDGLGVRVTPNGARSFVYWYWQRGRGSEGKRRLMTLGQFPMMSVSEANAAHLAARTLQAKRLDPVEERRKAEAAEQEAQRALGLAENAASLTVRKLFEKWRLAELVPPPAAKPNARPPRARRRRGRKDEGAFTTASFNKRVFPDIGDRLATEVRQADLLRVLDAVKAEGKLRTANVLLADLRQMFAWATKRELVPRNPADAITKWDVGGEDVERDRTLEDDELRDLAAGLASANMSARSVAAIWLITSTATRLGEAMGAVWADHGRDAKALQERADKAGCKFGVVDLGAKTWHLPDTKNNRQHLIHLSHFALAQFERLAAMRPLDDRGCPVPWVFPNMALTGPLDAKTLQKQIKDRQRSKAEQMKNRAGSNALALRDGAWTAHDLRRSAANIMARIGISTDVIDECLNHKLQSKVARVYIIDPALMNLNQAA